MSFKTDTISPPHPNPLPPGERGLLNQSTLLVNLLYIFLFSSLVIILSLYHEPWRDEAQSWLLVSHLDLGGLFHIMSYEGSPALWHVILYPFAQLEFSYATEFVIHILIAIATVSLFVFRSPYSWLTKLLFVVSYFVMYEYAVIARSYVLSIFFLFLMAELYQQRFQKALWYGLVIALLANSNTHSLVIAFGFCSFYVFELIFEQRGKTRLYMSSFIMIAGIVFALFLLLPHGDNIHHGFFDRLDIPAPFVAIRNAIFPGYGFLYKGLTTTVALIIFPIILASVFNNKKIFIPVGISILGLLYVFMFKHNGSMRHHGLIFMLLIMAKWIDLEDKGQMMSVKNMFLRFSQRYAPLLINIILFISATFMALTFYREISFNFSGSKDVAEFLKKKQLIHHVIVAHPSPQATAILPYFPGKKLWFANIKEFATYGTYNKIGYDWARVLPNDELVQRVRQESRIPKDHLLLLTKPLSEKLTQNYVLLFATDDQKFTEGFGYGTDERFYLYRSVL